MAGKTCTALSILLLCALVNVHANTAPCGATVNQNNFNHYKNDQGLYRPWTETDALCDYPRTSKRQSYADPEGVAPGLKFIKGWEDRGDRVDVGGDGKLRSEHPENCTTTAEVGGCGLLYNVWLPEPLTHATLSYKFQFEAGYDWTRGGKLPGMCDWDCPSGCEATNFERGFSSRVMWRTDGRLVSYMYLPPQSEDGTDSDGCGTDYEWIIGDNVQTSATDGVEHSVKIFVGINTFENGEPVADGVQRVWLDDELVFEKTDWIYDWTGTHLIEQLQFHNFHGGSDPKKFGPDRLQVILFDDVAIQEGECPPGEDYDPEFVEKSATCNENPPAPSAPLPVNPPRAPPMIPDQCIASGKCGDWEGQTFCCEGDLECVRKNDFYYACREVGEIPDLKENEWGGEIYRNGVVVDGPLPDNPAPDDPAPDDPAPPSPSVPSQCIASGKCGGEDGQTACCEGELECVRKNQYYYACREVADICTLRDSGWEGKIYRDGEQVDPDEVACDFKEEEDDDEVDWVEPPTESCDILPSVPTYKKCGDETGKIACCTSDDLCLRKDGYYAQCRPENKKKSDWWNFEL